MYRNTKSGKKSKPPTFLRRVTALRCRELLKDMASLESSSDGRSPAFLDPTGRTNIFATGAPSAIVRIRVEFAREKRWQGTGEMSRFRSKIWKWWKFAPNRISCWLRVQSRALNTALLLFDSRPEAKQDGSSGSRTHY